MFHQGSLFDDDMVATGDAGGCSVSHLTLQGQPLSPPPLATCIHKKCRSRGDQITDGYCMSPKKNTWICKLCLDDFDRWIAWDKKKRDDEWNKALKNGWFLK